MNICIGIAALGMALLPQPVNANDTDIRVSTASETLSAPLGGSAPSRTQTPSGVANHGTYAYFGKIQASRDARDIAAWIVHSADNRGLPFIIVDKIDARVFVFNTGGRVQGSSPVLLGLARGDDTVAGIGDREYADMPPETRTTPAGRFVAALGMNARGEDVVWVDYDAAISLHRVITSNREERRLERLATPTPLDNRISYGCINVPVRFYETVVRPAFAGRDAIVYVLPETRPAQLVFGSYDVEERTRQQQAVQPPHALPLAAIAQTVLNSQ